MHEHEHALPRGTVQRARTAVDARGVCDAQFALLAPLLRERLAGHGVRDAVAGFYTPMALPLPGAVPAPAVGSAPGCLPPSGSGLAPKLRLAQ